MSVRTGLGERFIVPRWRSFDATRRTGELGIPGTPDAVAIPIRQDGDSRHYQELMEFEESPGLHQASDILDRAASGDRPLDGIAAIAAFVTANSDSTHEQRRLAEGALRLTRGSTFFDDRELSDAQQSHRKAAAEIRRRLRRQPRNPVLWMDFALAQTVEGNLQKAERSVQAALHLAPDSRFVLRAASRFYVHIDDYERAWHLLDAPARDSSDPWLRAAEIAIADLMDISSKNIRSSRRDLSMGRFDPGESSELACAIASHEIDAGQDKSGRRMMTLALEQPTENAVAQAEFESQRANIIVPEHIVAQEGRFEAQAVDFGARSEWSSAVSAARRWQDDQPFASDPATYLSYLASVGLEDFRTAELAAQRGATANPQNVTLANNWAFALANQGNTASAQRVLDRIASITLEESDALVVQATEGLIAFRSGDANRGRSLYAASTNDAFEQGLHDQGALAYAYWAREELRADTDQSLEIVALARVEIEKFRTEDAITVFNRALTRSSYAPREDPI